MFIFTPVLHDAAYTLYLLLRSVGLSRRRAHPTRRLPLIGVKPLHGHLALQINLEHYLELYYHSLIIHLDCCPPERSIPEEASGKRLD